MKDYTKPCTREENPDHIILHVGTNDLSSDNSPERVGKSIVDLFQDNRKVTISGIIPRNDEWNNKAELVNNHLNEMCTSANILFFKFGIHFMQGWTATTRMELQEKKHNKDPKNLFSKNLQLKDVC